MNELIKYIRKMHLKVVVAIEGFETDRTREMTESNEDLLLSGYPVIVGNLGWDIHKSIIII